MFCTSHDQIKAEKIPVLLERCIPISSVAIASAMYIYALCYRDAQQDLHNQDLACSRCIKDALDRMGQNIKVYNPKQGGQSKNNELLQNLANQANYPVIKIKEEDLINGSESSVLLFFAQAKKLSPCIIYIEKKAVVTQSIDDMLRDRMRDLSYKTYDYFYNKRDIAYQKAVCHELFTKEMQLLQEQTNQIVVLGIAKNNIIKSSNDIFSLSFNVDQQNPSYKERVEILNLLLSKKNLTVTIEKIAQKTIGFSYNNILQLIYEVIHIDTINNDHINKAYAVVIKAHNIDVAFLNSPRKTYIHEMGHAIAIAHFDKNFILRNVSATPQCSLVSNQRNVTELGYNQYSMIGDNKNDTAEKTNANTQQMMICFAGKIAEQMVFGLPNNKRLNVANGYADLIDNPGGATDDLLQARRLSYTINGQNSEKLLKASYAQALELLLSYKDKILEGAQLLEQQEFITGSQVYHLLGKNK